MGPKNLPPFYWVKFLPFLLGQYSPFYRVNFAPIIESIFPPFYWVNLPRFIVSMLLLFIWSKISPFYWVKNSPLLFGFQPAVANVNLEMVTLNFYLFEVFWRANGKCIDTPASSTGNFDPRKIVSTPSVSYINTAVHYEDPFVRSDVDMHREQNWIIRNSFLVLIRTETSTA